MSSHCFSCGHTIPSKELVESSKKQLKTYKKKEQDLTIVPSGKPPITTEQREEIKSETTVNISEFRGIRAEISKLFGVRYAMDEHDNILEQYYPCTQDGQLVGYKIRELPKDFRSVGLTGAECELFGQFKFNRGGKYVIITEGEIDQLSAYQMFKDYNDNRNSTFEIAVVSPTTGANSHKQIAAQYKFFDSFENIVLCYDNDKAGKDAVEKIIPVLPKGKVKIMNLRFKDPNEYLEKEEETLFIRDFWSAKDYTPTGVLASTELYDRILSQAKVAKVPFPPFMGKLNEMFVGGMPLGHIVNIAADTGIGKTTLVNEMIYYWVFNSPHMVGVVSMELDAGQYGETLLSRHLSKKLALIGDYEEKIEYLKNQKIEEKSKELLFNEDGGPRFYLLDNRDGTVEEIQETIEQLVISCGCKVIVLDPLQDVLDGLSNEDQAVFMKWAKGFIKSHGVLFIFINHMRKTPAGQSGGDNEQNIMGSSTIIKSASANILLKRDKSAEDPIVRNTTTIDVPKNRVCGLTGPAGATYYENETHTLHNLDDWLNANA